MQKPVVLIPAYEPGEQLIELLEKLKEKELDLVVVDDGSGEDYAGVFEKARQYAQVLEHPENRGKGEALKTGLSWIWQHVVEPYVVVTADADGQHSPEDILRVAEEASAHPEELVLGSRKIDRSVPLRSRLGNTITRYVYRLSSGCRVYDTQTGLRGFSCRNLPFMLEVRGSRYEYEMNVLMAWARQGRKIREITIRTIYLEGNESSHFDTVKDSWRIYREILMFSGSSLVSFLADYGLFALFYALFSSLALSAALVAANILARILSATLNYTLNRRAVFRAGEKVSQSLPRYAALAVAILILNTLILRLLTALGLPALAAKILTELSLFVLSWTVQKRYVFRERHEGRPKRKEVLS